MKSEAIMNGAFVLLGAVIGALASMGGQYVLQARQDSYHEHLQTLKTAREIITLVEETPASLLSENQAINHTPPHLIVPAAYKPSLIVALATLDFPSATKPARGYEAESAKYLESLTGVRLGKVAQKVNQHDMYCAMEAGDQVTAAVLKSLHRPYDKRNPVVPLSTCKAYQYEMNH